jgi:hypothetical protein
MGLHDGAGIGHGNSFREIEGTLQSRPQPGGKRGMGVGGRDRRPHRASG